MAFAVQHAAAGATDARPARLEALSLPAGVDIGATTDAFGKDEAVSRLPLGAGAVDAALSGGLAVNALHEVRCTETRGIGAAAGFVAGLLARLAGAGAGRFVWITDPGSLAGTGSLFPRGLAQYGVDPAGFTLVIPCDLTSALWAAEIAAASRGVTAAVLQVKGNPARLDMTASRRLMLRARESGVFTLVLRVAGGEEASAAATRWRAEPAPSIPDPHDRRDIGGVRHVLVLERNRSGQTGDWCVAWNPETKAFYHAANPAAVPLADRPAPAPAYPVRRFPVSFDRPYRQAQVG